MKQLTFLALVAMLSGCLGYSSRNNEMIGQVKKVIHNTPLICPEFDDADISLGVMRNGVGSMSGEDNWVYVDNEVQLKVLREANEAGKLVKVHYNTARFAFCVPERWVTSVEIVE